MYRLNSVSILALAIGLTLLPSRATAEQKFIKDQLVGTWMLLLADYVRDDGSHVPSFGPNPKGMIIFTSDGHYSAQLYQSGRPPFASKNLLTGTADENKAAVQGMIASFGTYTVDEAGKIIMMNTEASSFPNWDGTVQKRTVAAISDEVLTLNMPPPSAAGYIRTEHVWKKAK